MLWNDNVNNVCQKCMQFICKDNCMGVECFFFNMKEPLTPNTQEAKDWKQES